MYLMRKQRWKGDDIGTVWVRVRSVRTWLFKFLWRGDPLALRLPCRVRGAALHDILSRVILCLVCSPTLKLNNREFTCLLLWPALVFVSGLLVWSSRAGCSDSLRKKCCSQLGRWFGGGLSHSYPNVEVKCPLCPEGLEKDSD